MPARALFPSWAERLGLPADETIDTPSLLSVGASPPYLGDGRAATLRAVFRDHDPAHRHGDSASLDDAELDDLVAFLESL